jgi:hypothetical protein
MKTIKPISIWSNGAVHSATLFYMYISYDDLNTQATFQYSLMTDSLVTLANGQFTMSGADYQNWDDSNEAAYLYAGYLLNLEITGDYVPPISEPASDEPAA